MHFFLFNAVLVIASLCTTVQMVINNCNQMSRLFDYYDERDRMNKYIRKAILRGIMGSPLMQPLTIGGFHWLWYRSRSTWRKHTFLGHPIKQCPLDLHLYQELIYRVRPSFILQTGVLYGGSILYFASLLDLIGAAPDVIVAGIDLELTPSARALTHPRIRLFEGSSTDRAVVANVRAALPAPTGFVVLDSDHSRDHVLSELSVYADLVSIDSYLVVEDTAVNGHCVHPSHGPGPWEAVDDFLRMDDRFIRDDEVWRGNLFSQHQGGWLRRVR